LLECDSLERTRLRGLEELFVVNIDTTSRRRIRASQLDHHSAASVGEMVYQLGAAGLRHGADGAMPLHDHPHDTGGFCYGNVRESTFALARELVQAGAIHCHRPAGLFFCFRLQVAAAGRGAAQA